MGNKQFTALAQPKCSAESGQVAGAQARVKSAEQELLAARNKLSGCDPKAYAPPAPSSSGDKCRIPRYGLNKAQNDLRNQQAEMDKCDTTGALQRRLAGAKAEAAAYAANVRKELAMNDGVFKQSADALDKLRESAVGLYGNLRDLEVELVDVRKKAQNFEQLERRERRSFLDSSPQSGVGGAPGVRTSDDRVLLAFWITYGAAVIALTFFGLAVYERSGGAIDAKTKAGAIALALLVAYTLAYPLISNYG
jgi:hypothetical protein